MSSTLRSLDHELFFLMCDVFPYHLHNELMGSFILHLVIFFCILFIFCSTKGICNLKFYSVFEDTMYL